MREHPRVGGGVPIRVVVVGPPQSGKTSFVTAAATESFPEHVPPALPPTLLSAHSLPDRVPCLLVDTSSRAEDRAQLASQLRSAHVVVLCYAADAPRQATLLALRTEWLPELRRAASSRPGWPLPVVLLGCKLDAVAAAGQAPGTGGVSVACLASELAGEAPTGCVDASLECSARTLVAVHAAVYAACAAVLHPVAPLFDARQQALTPDALAALRRIFVLCDADGDAALSERELSAFQAACYGVPLASGEVADVLRTVGERLPQGVTPRGGLSLVGFLFTQALLLQHGRCDAVWAALRAFGYGPQLTLQLDALPPGAQALRGRGGGEHPSLELTSQGAAFLAAAFSHACGGATHMRWPQLEALFATSPGGAAGAVEALGWTHAWRWPDAVQPTGAGLTCAAFTALWALSGATHPGAVVQQLCYLCYPGDPATAVRLLGRSQGAHTGGVTARLLRPRHTQQPGLPPGQTPGGLLPRGRRTAVLAVIGPTGDGLDDDTVASLLDALHARLARDAGVSCGDISTPVPTSHGAGGARAGGQTAAHAVLSPSLVAAPYASTPVRTPPAQQAMGGEKGIAKQRVVVVAAPLESDPSAPVVPGTPVGGVSYSQGGGGGGGEREEEVPFVALLLTPPAGWMSAQGALRPWHGSARPDLLLFPFDARSRTSFGAAARRLNEWATATAARGPRLPALLLATHPAEEQHGGGDARLAWDDGLVEAFTASLGIPAPEEVWSGQPGQVNAVLARLAQAALCPEPVVPETRAARARRLRLRSLRRGAAATVGGAALLGGGLYLYKAYHRSSASS